MTTQVPASMTVEGVTAAQITALQTRATNLENSSSLPAGVPVQHTYLQAGAVGTGTTVLPGDDTIPQNTEGDQYLTLAFTPRKSTSRLCIEVVMVLAHTQANALMAVALFQDSTANALAAAAQSVPLANDSVVITLRHFMTAGTTSSTTFKVRAGGSAAGTTTFNGSGSARLFGGVMTSSISITEIQV